MTTKLMILAAAALLASCGGNSQQKAVKTCEPVAAAAADMHNAENSLDVAGVYKGTLPAADCPGIAVTLTLNEDGTYIEHNEYLERNVQFDDKGGYSIRENLLTLTPEGGEGICYYRIGENRLDQLDADKQPIEGEMAEFFILKKVTE